ncbi:beta-casein [Acomys russatus]|uniref:beta-casein n=1 Tax=Acomys russatus TaxID=60746 RepID=UPI0021E231AB|nr:beta-casein [Acomys russatus]
MKVFILACLVALALASETESASSSEESIVRINEKLQKVQRMEQVQAEDMLQDKVNPFIQAQPQAFPYAQPISCTPLAQNVQPIAQPPVVPSLGPVISPELEAFLKAKATILPKHKVMPFSNSETLLRLFNSQIPSLAELANQHPSQSLVQLLAQAVQAFPQSPVASSQYQLSALQSKVLQFLEQVASFLQGDMSAQDLLQYLELLLNPAFQVPTTQQLHPITTQQKSINLLAIVASLVDCLLRT